MYLNIFTGASAVQGTHYYKKGITCFTELKNGLKFIMELKNYNKISEFKGRILLKNVFN